MMPKAFNFKNFSSRYPMATGQQTAADKDKIIADAKETIAKMQERLKTEKNPAIRARCEEIIQNQLEKIERERVSKHVLKQNPFGELCDLKSRRR
ncbi:MAG: hypothetical protein IKL95_00155 [Alphaproteobacteria bacterium]|nr:hypothetical protein [Alphaproteobacteria bacterium]